MRTYEVIRKKNVSSPLSVEDAKAHLNLESDYVEDDGYIGGLIKSAERFCSGILSSDISETSVKHVINNFLGGTIRSQENPFMSMTKVTHIDSEGTETEITSDDYVIRESQYFFDLILSSSIGGEDHKIKLEYITGQNKNDISDDIISAIKIKVATLYDHEREDYMDYKLKSNRAINSLLAPYIRLL